METGRRATAALIVEDDPALMQLLVAVLRETLGWKVVSATDAASAARAFRREPVDVLLLDVNLPGCETGPALLTRLRCSRRWSNPVTIFMSADIEQPGVHEAIAQGLARYAIAKPFDLDTLVEALQCALAERAAHAPAA